jgi:hypothetical protein
MYYTDWGSAGHVGKVQLDGSNREVLLTKENPNDLAISNRKLLVINNKMSSAEIIEVDLSNGGTYSRPLSNTVGQSHKNETLHV